MAQTSSLAANTDTPRAVSPPSGDLAQLSYSGTPRGPDGTTTPDDYHREMADPVRRMQIFEEMRASDDAVHAAIEARRQEINAANWVLASEDKTPLGTEILEFVEDNVYPLLDQLLRLLGGGGIQYGFGAVEPVYVWADRPVAGIIARGKTRRPARSERRGIYLAKLAHLRQQSVETFRITPTGDLEDVVQHAYNGMSYRRVVIPGQKLLLWTYDQQGDDRWGVPPTRHCFKAWKIKEQIEKLNLLHTDRFAVGMPTIEEGEGWSAPERQQLAAFMRSWRASGTGYLLYPKGGKITIVADDGKTTLSMLEWVKYYNIAIAKTFLTQASELGTTNTGARAVGETMVEQMGALVQADSEDLASIINERLIKYLVDINFGPQPSYPNFQPTQRVKLNGAMASALGSLIGVNLLHPRPEDEVLLRDVYGMPTVPLEVLTAAQDARSAKADAIATSGAGDGGADPSAPGPDPVDGAGSASSAASPRPALVAASRSERRAEALALSIALSEGAPTPAVRGVSSYRTSEYAAWEQTIVRPDVLMRDLDLQSARLTSEVQDVLRAIDEDLTSQVEAHATDSAEALSAAVRTIAVPERLRKQLRSVLLTAAQRARDYGTLAVKNEVERQVGPSGVGAQRSPSIPYASASDPTFYARIGRAFLQLRRALAAGDEPIDAKRARDLRLAAQVDAAVESEVSRREQGVRTSMLAALTQAAGAVSSVLAGVATTAAKASLIGLSPGRTQQAVQSVVNVGFGIGRSDMADAVAQPAGAGSGGGGRSGLRDGDGNPVEFVRKVYSAVMDLGTCDECAKWDGAEFPIDYPEDVSGVQAPNPRCAGSEQNCRCIWIYITDRESTPIVPAEKGPVPFSPTTEGA